MNNSLQIDAALACVTAFFKEHADADLLYHNYNHTVTVVKRVNEIATHYQLTPTEIFVLNAAAWFHDTGQLVHYGEGHEEFSASIMSDFFQTKEVEAGIIQSIQQCIVATKVPHQPYSFLDKVICDADTYNLGTDEFQHTDALLKREREQRGFPTDHWDENTLQLLLHHRYHTPYCQELLNETKAKNIVFVRNRMIEKKATTLNE